MIAAAGPTRACGSAQQASADIPLRTYSIEIVDHEIMVSALCEDESLTWAAASQ
jgi:hypothetical protein